MPAYRSSAEGEIRDAVVARIRAARPAARIIHEVNCAGQGTNRFDLIAVDRTEIIAVEVKSQKDKLDRLPAQINAMRRSAHHVVVALHDKFLVEKKTNQWAAHYERDGEFYLRALPDAVPYHVSAWVYPETRRAMATAGHDRLDRWDLPPQHSDTSLPADALDMLWREELYELCGALRVSVGRRATMIEMSRLLRWLSNGRELTVGICAALRARRCIEADPEIEEKAAA